MHHNKPFKTYAPFGIATKRFNKVGFHPELDRSGAMKREITKTGPGSYNPREFRCKYKKGMCWKQKLEVEEFSKFLGFRNANILRERNFFKSMRGPGTNDLNDDLFKKQSNSVLKNVGFGAGERFVDSVAQAPPPNTYFKNVSKKMEKSKCTFSELPTFEWDDLQDRFRPDSKSYYLAANRYNPQDHKNLSDITKKVVSLRGPYELFTGPRDGTTIKNNFAPPLSSGPDYFYIEPSHLEYLLHHPTKTRYGKFLRGQRFQRKPTVRSMLNDLSLCYRDPNDPGPASYDIHADSIKYLDESIHPFDSSNIHARPPTDWRIAPGPGRYYPRQPRCMKAKRPSWVFLSKQNRDLFKLVRYSLYDGVD